MGNTFTSTTTKQDTNTTTENVTNSSVQTSSNYTIAMFKQHIYQNGFWDIITNPEYHTLFAEKKGTLVNIWGAFWYLLKGLKLTSGEFLSMFLQDKHELPSKLVTIADVLEEIENGVESFKIRDIELPLDEKINYLVTYLKSLASEENLKEIYILTTRTVLTTSGETKPCFALGLPESDDLRNIIDLGSGGGREVDPKTGIQGAKIDYEPKQEETNEDGIPVEMCKNIAQHFGNLQTKPKMAYGTAYWRNNPEVAKVLSQELQKFDIPYRTLSADNEAKYGTQSMVNIFLREKMKRNESLSEESQELIPHTIISAEFGRESGQVGYFNISH